MKVQEFIKKHPLVFLSFLIVSFLIVLHYNEHGSDLHAANTSTPVVTNTVSSVPVDKIEDRIEDKIGNKEYYNRDDYDYPTILKFDPIDNNNNGVMGALTISHTNRPTMGNDVNGINKSCNYYFTYTIQGDRILATFTSSDCGGTSANMILTYDNGSGYIVMKSGKGELVFKPMN